MVLRNRDRNRVSRRNVIKTGGAATVAGLAGCLGDDDTADDDDDGDTGDDTTTDDDDEQTTISFWPAWGGYYEETFTEMVESFEERHPDINVEMEAQGDYSESRSQAFSAANAGDPPDVAHISKQDVITAIDTGFFTPMEEIIPDIDRDDYIGPAVGFSEVEGTLWSLPFNNSQVVMYYNREHFEDAGLDPDDPPTTFAEMTEAAQTIVEEDVAEYGITWPNVTWFIEAWISEKGEFMADQENGRLGEPTETYFSEPYSQDIYDWWMNELGDAYHNPGQDDWGSSEQAFQTGEASMHLNSTGSLAYHIDGFTEQGIDVDVAPLITPDEESTNGHHMGGAAIWVMEKDRTEEELEALRKFILDMAGPEQQALYHRQTGYFPSHRESFDILEEEGWFEENEEFNTAYQQYQEWEELPMTQGIFMGPWPQVEDRLITEAAEMLGGKDIAEATEDIDEFAAEELSLYERTL